MPTFCIVRHQNTGDHDFLREGIAFMNPGLPPTTVALVQWPSGIDFACCWLPLEGPRLLKSHIHSCILTRLTSPEHFVAGADWRRRCTTAKHEISDERAFVGFLGMGSHDEHALLSPPE